MIVTTYISMFGSLPPSPLVGLRLQSLLGLAADIVMESFHSSTLAGVVRLAASLRRFHERFILKRLPYVPHQGNCLHLGKQRCTPMSSRLTGNIHFVPLTVTV